MACFPLAGLVGYVGLPILWRSFFPPIVRCVKITTVLEMGKQPRCPARFSGVPGEGEKWWWWFKNGGWTN